MTVKKKLQSVNDRPVIDRKEKKLPKEPEMKRLKDVVSGMKPENKQRTEDYLKAKENDNERNRF